MDRLHAEAHRLFLAPDQDGADAVRAVRVDVLRPAGWQETAAVWRGVQADMDLPAPGIAVSGGDGYQLWFSFAQAVPRAQAEAFGDAVRRRFLGAVPPERVRVRVPAEADLPPARIADERWSAFLAPDLAPLFADEPWLDHPPGADAQAELLSRLQPIAPEAFARALDAPAPPAAPQRPGAPADDGLQPRAFLLQVMRDPAVDLALRVEAAKALLR